MAQPARPRPRPRLVSRQPAVSGEAQVTNAVNDEDDLFRRNRGRTAQHWRQLEQFAAKATPFRSDDGWASDDPEEGSSSKSRKKKKLIKRNDRPRWQDTDVARILSSDNDDDDIQIIEHTSRNIQGNVSPKKRKRDRSRPESITPPPELPAQQRADAMNLVRQALAIQPRPPSPPSFLDDSTDTIDLDPELAKIAEAARQQVKHSHIDPARTGGPETVNIKVHWRPHPLNPSAQEQCWTFNMGRHDTFRELFDGVADLAGVMADQVVINHDHRRVFASGTPHSLHMWAEGELEACDKHTAEYIRTQRSNGPLSPSHPDGTSRRSPPSAPQSDVGSEAESAGGDTIKLVLRSSVTKDKSFTLTVRSTTTCGTIVKAFLKAAGLPDSYSGVASTSRTAQNPFPYLVVDGDKMSYEAEIGDADLEDGDLVEVVGV